MNALSAIPSESPDSPPTVICFALREEAAPFRRLLHSRKDVLVVVTGVGKTNSRKALKDTLARFKPVRLFTCGFAGGLNPRLASGDLVMDADPEFDRLPLLRAAGIKPIRFLCGDRILSTVSEKQSAWENTGCDAVEMESEAIRILCREQGVPSATVRVISDAATETLPLDFNLLMKPDQSIHFGRLALALLKEPWKVPALVRMNHRFQNAARKLAQALWQALPAQG